MTSIDANGWGDMPEPLGRLPISHIRLWDRRSRKTEYVDDDRDLWVGDEPERWEP